jgi:hypothetical protein
MKKYTPHPAPPQGPLTLWETRLEKTAPPNDYDPDLPPPPIPLCPTPQGLSIDRLSLTYPVRGKGRARAHNEQPAITSAARWFTNLTTPPDIGDDEWRPPLHDCHGSARFTMHWRILNEYDLQLAPTTTRGATRRESYEDPGWLRLEYNPAHADLTPLADLNFFYAIAPWIAWERPRITRIDFAIDYAQAISATGWKVPNVTHTETISGPEGPETYYIGARSSARRFRIYNKAREQTKVRHTLTPWWRVEVQWRPEDPIPDDPETPPPNPFTDLERMTPAGGAWPLLLPLVERIGIAATLKAAEELAGQYFRRRRLDPYLTPDEEDDTPTPRAVYDAQAPDAWKYTMRHIRHTWSHAYAAATGTPF